MGESRRNLSQKNYQFLRGRPEIKGLKTEHFQRFKGSGIFSRKK